MTRKMRGFKIGRKIRRVSAWIFRRTRSPAQYNRLDSPTACKIKPFSKLISWGRRCLIAAKSNRSGYVPLGQEPVRDQKPAVHVPKGHMAVYVGQKDGDFRRVLVPVIYVNHPLFSDLLREAEEEYGFNQQGGITIPCRFAEFDRVRSRIKEIGRCSGAKPATSRRDHRRLGI